MDDNTIQHNLLFLDKQELALQQQFLVLETNYRRLNADNLINKGTAKEQNDTRAALSELKLQKDRVLADLHYLGQIKQEVNTNQFKFE